MNNFQKVLDILREEKALFAVADGWDEDVAVTMTFNSKYKAQEWIDKANEKSPGRWKLKTVGTKDGYELSTDDDIKRYTAKYI